MTDRIAFIPFDLVFRNNNPCSDIAMTVWIYVDMSKDVGDRDQFKVFATADAAERWFDKHDPEGVAFEYPLES